jgi:hypothetical protein
MHWAPCRLIEKLDPDLNAFVFVEPIAKKLFFNRFQPI